jgi:toxin-antitoxin system PIN domain toxin
MIAVDTNILIYAHRKDAVSHNQAATVINRLAEGKTAWSIPWPCIHEFLAIVTHTRIFSPPSTLTEACRQVAAWFESPMLVMLGEEGGYWPVLERTLSQANISGPKVHDARIAALCLHHGVNELWSADRDFKLFPTLSTRNPLLSETVSR